MSAVKPGVERLLSPGQVARMMGVHAKTVTRWALAGKLAAVITPGGHRRYRESEIRALLRGERPGGVDA